MITKSIFAGFGGQGILSMGHMLAYAAMREDKYVTYLPAYGAEVRGGTANCTVSIGDEEIASPIASNPEYIIVMNAPSLDRFQNMLVNGGSCLLNTTLVRKQATRKDIKIYELAASDMAEELGEIRSTNILMLGAFVKITQLVKPETLLDVVKETFGRKKPEILERNQEAFWKGYNAVS